MQCWNSRNDKARPRTDLFSIFVSYKGGVIFSICRTDKISDVRTTAMLQWYQPFYFSRVGYNTGICLPSVPRPTAIVSTVSILTHTYLHRYRLLEISSAFNIRHNYLNLIRRDYMKSKHGVFTATRVLHLRCKVFTSCFIHLQIMLLHTNPCWIGRNQIFFKVWKMSISNSRIFVTY